MLMPKRFTINEPEMLNCISSKFDGVSWRNWYTRNRKTPSGQRFYYVTSQSLGIHKLKIWRMTGAFTWVSCTTLLEMWTKPVNMRATTATRTGCARHRVGHKTPFSGCGSRNAAEDPRPNILQLNTEGLTANKISDLEQMLAYINKAFIIVLKETHSTSADKLVIPNFW